MILLNTYQKLENTVFSRRFLEEKLPDYYSGLWKYLDLEIDEILQKFYTPNPKWLVL